MSLTCRHCGLELTEDTWGKYVRQRAVNWHTCNDCVKRLGQLHSVQYRKNHQLEIRNNYLNIKTPKGRRSVKVEGKRPYSGSCELCGNRNRRLSYHHWDDNDYSKGFWLCTGCHVIAEGVEKGTVSKYIELKRSLECLQP